MSRQREYEKFAVMLISTTDDMTAYVHITSSQNVERTLRRANGEDPGLERRTRRGAPHWRVACVSGPMHGVTEYCSQWRDTAAADQLIDATTVLSLLTRGKKLASEKGVFFYLDTLPPKESMEK